jgi:hypothetical protein
LPSREKAINGMAETPSGRTRYQRPEGLTEKGAKISRAIKDHPDIVAKIKAQARENEGIRTETAVLEN